MNTRAPDAARLRQLLAVQPNDRVAWHNLAAAEGDLGRASESEAAARRAIALGIAAPETRLVLAARIELVENMGDTTVVDCTVDDMPIKWRVDGVPAVREGDVVHLTAAPEALHVFDATTGQRR